MQISYVPTEIKTSQWQAPFSLDLMGRMLMDKADRHEKFQASIQGAIDQYGNLPILNEGHKQYAKEKLSGVITKLNDMGSMDLSKRTNQMQLQGIVSEFGRDSRIVNAIADSRRISTLQAKYQEDLEKHPENIVNYTLFMDDVNRYATGTDPEQRYRGRDFMTYVDVDKSYQEMLDKLKSDQVLKQQPDGSWLYTHENEVVTPERIEQIVYSHMESNPGVKMQMQNNAEYNVRNISDIDLRQSYRHYAQNRLVEKQSALPFYAQKIEEWNAQPDSAEKRLKLAQFTETKKQLEGEIAKLSGLATDDNQLNTYLQGNKRGAINELYVSNVANKFKNVYAFSKDNAFQMHDRTTEAEKAMFRISNRSSSKDGESDSEASAGEPIITFETDVLGEIPVTDAVLRDNVSQAQSNIDRMKSDLSDEVASVTGGMDISVDQFIKEQRDNINNGRPVSYQYIKYHNQLIKEESKLQYSKTVLENATREAKNGVLAQEHYRKIPSKISIGGNEVFQKEDVLSFMSQYATDLETVGDSVFSRSEQEALKKKIVENSNSPVAKALASGRISMDDIFYEYTRGGGSSGTGPRVYKNFGQEITTAVNKSISSRIPGVLVESENPKQKPLVAKLTAVIEDDLARSKQEPRANIVPMKYFQVGNKLFVRYKFGDKESPEYGVTEMTDSAISANGFGGLLRNDPYQELTNVVMLTGQTAPANIKDKSYQATSPIISVPYQTKNENGETVTKQKIFYVRFQDTKRWGAHRRSEDVMRSVPEQGINIGIIQYIDPANPTGWIPMNQEGTGLPIGEAVPITSVEQAMKTAQAFLTATVQKSNRTK